MNEALQFLLRHGYGLLFLFVLAEQLGLPLPAVPVLLAAGALAGMDRLSPGGVLGAAVGASLLADLFWYELGRRRGSSVLGFLCRISLEPDSCVRRTESSFARHGTRALLVAKFIPGLSTAAPPLAGMLRMSPFRFLLCDGLGALLWAGTFTGLGYLFSDQLERVADQALRLGTWLALLLGVGLAVYLLAKYRERRRFLGELRIARISPEEVKRKLDAGEPLFIVDLRHPIDLGTDRVKIAGALHLPVEQLEHRHAEIPRDREIVLYCT